MKKSKILAGALTAAAAACGFDRRLEVTSYEISSPKIPKSFDKFKIVHISDYHNDSVLGVSEKIRRICPDIIVMTGDMTHDKHKSYEPAVILVKRLVKIAPCFMVSGNHDIWRCDYQSYVDECKNSGAVFLQNESHTLKKTVRKSYCRVWRTFSQEQG